MEKLRKGSKVDKDINKIFKKHGITADPVPGGFDAAVFKVREKSREDARKLVRLSSEHEKSIRIVGY